MIADIGRGDQVLATPRGFDQTQHLYVVKDISSVPLYHLERTDQIGIFMVTTDVILYKKQCDHRDSISARDKIDPRIEFCAYCGEKL